MAGKMAFTTRSITRGFEGSRVRGALIFISLAAMPSICRACPIPADMIRRSPFEIRAGTFRYVAPTGNDANADSAQSRWRHLQTAADHAVAGDTVCRRGGSYNELLAFSAGGSALDGEIAFEAAIHTRFSRSG